MKVIIAILILASFLQSTILSIDLVSIILIFKSFISREKSNLYLAFFIGLLMSFLTFAPLGIYSLLYLLMVEVMTMVAKIRAWSTVFVLIPSLILLLILNIVVVCWISHQSIIIWPRIGWDLIVALPAYFLIRFWEERFVVKPEVKLKV